MHILRVLLDSNNLQTLIKVLNRKENFESEFKISKIHTAQIEHDSEITSSKECYELKVDGIS